MSRTTPWLAIILAVFVAFAGCTRDGATPTPTSPTATTPGTTPTMTPTVTPTVTTPATPDANASGRIDSVTVVSLTDGVARRGDADVCWRVEGTGSIAHTAIHFDDEPHPNATAFAEYDGGALYPNNRGSPETSYPLPGTFCAQLRHLESTTYLRAHAMVSGPASSQMLSVEKVVPVAEARNVTFVDFREIFPGTFANQVCWRVTGLEGETTHTAIHFDDESHPQANATQFGLYDGGAIYAGNAAAQDFSATVPGTFCANLTMPETGARYLRAHLILNGTHHISEERVVVAAPRVAVTGGLAETADAGATVQVCWRAEGAGEVAHTALHFDTDSHPDATGFAVYDGGAVYPDNDADGGPWALPGPFCGNLTMPASGTLYFRPHAVFEGAFSELGPEYAIRVA